MGAMRVRLATMDARIDVIRARMPNLRVPLVWRDALRRRSRRRMLDMRVVIPKMRVPLPRMRAPFLKRDHRVPNMGVCIAQKAARSRVVGPRIETKGLSMPRLETKPTATPPRKPRVRVTTRGGRP
jgi:hypothetical protein